MCINVRLNVWLCMQCPWEKGIGSPGTEVTGGCELPRGCQESNLGPLGEHPMFLTTEPLLQPHHYLPSELYPRDIISEASTAIHRDKTLFSAHIKKNA